MIEYIRTENFTILPNDEWKFAPGLNIIVGENGVGKTHILKCIYALLKVQTNKRTEITKTTLEKTYAKKLIGIMRPEFLGRLVKRKQGHDRCEIYLGMQDKNLNSVIAFASNAKKQVEILELPKLPSKNGFDQSPVYLPTRELVTLCPWFIPIFDNYHLEFDETWRDTVSLLGAPSIKGEREKNVAELLKPLEQVMDGKVVVDPGTGRFYLHVYGEGKLEMPLVAEGLRKIAMLARLISTGILLERGYLFWDEPETNLNTKLIKIVAQCVMSLCKQGIQVFMISHSIFLLRELEILAAREEFKQIKQRYFSLACKEGGVMLEQGDTIYELKSYDHSYIRFIPY